MSKRPFLARVKVNHRRVYSRILVKVCAFLKSLFWMKQIQGSKRVKINEYVHTWYEFLFASLLVILHSFLPQN